MADKFRCGEIRLQIKNTPNAGNYNLQMELLADFTPDRKKFPEGFGKMTKDLKEKNGIRWMGVWHALGGFWTMHPDAMKHSLLRAVSGGPAYVSDKPGATDPGILKPLIYQDGEILMMDRSEKPTEDCAFSDPLTDGVLKLHNVAPYGNGRAGGIAVYNLTGRKQQFSFAPADIPDLDMAESYRVYDYFSRKSFLLGRNMSPEHRDGSRKRIRRK